MDGQLVALDAGEGGRELWSIPTDSQPLLSTTLSDIELYRGDTVYRLIPSLDGNLYMYDEGHSGTLQAIPVSAESLLRSSLRFGQDVVAGGRRISTLGVNILTGEVHYSCSTDNCGGPSSTLKRQEGLIVRRTTQTVRAVDASTGVEKWNVTVGEHELLMAQDHYSSYTSHTSTPGWEHEEESCRDADWLELWRQFEHVKLQINPPAGYVAAIDTRDNSIIWETILQSPIAQAWDGREGRIKEMSLFDSDIVPNLSFLNLEDGTRPSENGNPVAVARAANSLLYIGTYEKDLYVIPSKQERNKLQLMLATANYNAAAAGIAQETQNLDPHYKKKPSHTHALVPREPERLYLPDTSMTKYNFYTADDMPTLVDDEGCFENCPTCSSDEVHALISRQQEINHNMGWYLMKQPVANSRQQQQSGSRWSFWRRKSGSQPSLPFGLLTAPDSVTKMGVLISWWRTIVLCFMTSVLTTIGMKVWYDNRRTRIIITDSQSPSIPSANTPVFEKDTNESPPIIPTSQSSYESTESVSENGNYTSRFLQDFEPVRCLGKGGFGVVYQVKNKLDDCSYAVKRIAVSNSETSKEKVMREVKALAKLDHPGIVRYFQAWLENPPLGWQALADAQILTKCGGVMEADDALFLGESTFPSEPFLSKIHPKIRTHSTQLLDGKASAYIRNSDDKTEKGANVILNNNNKSDDTDLDLSSFSHDMSSFDTSMDQREVSVGWSSNDAEVSKVASNDVTSQVQNEAFSSSDSSTDENPSPIPLPNLRQRRNHRKPEPSHLNVSSKDTSKAGNNESLEIVFADSIMNSEDQSQKPKKSAAKDVDDFSKSSSLFNKLGHLKSTSETSYSGNTDTSAFVVSGKKNSKEKDAETTKKVSKMYLYIQMQLCQALTLRHWLAENKTPESRMDRSLLLDWFVQILLAVEYIHDCGLIHRDLKPSNIFFAQDGRVRVGDFGLVTAVSEDAEEFPDEKGDSKKKSKGHTNCVGTRLYMSPEQSAGVSYTHKVDIYSLGVIFLEMMIPFGTEMERVRTLQGIRSLTLPTSFLQQMPQEADFVNMLVAPNPEDRPNCADIRENELLRDVVIPDIALTTKSRRTRTSSSGTGFSSVSIGGHSNPSPHSSQGSEHH